MLQFWKDIKVFTFCILVLAAASILIICTTEKFNLHIILNSIHNHALDIAFITLTHLGSGWALAVVVLLLLLINLRLSIVAAVAGIASSFIVQLLKRVVFGYNRPSYYIDMMPGLSTVDNYELYQNFSFPSGHATTAFILFFVLSLLTNKTWLKIALFISAIIIAYSRVYLSQHFFEDIIAGALLGFVIAVVTVYFCNNKVLHKLNQPVVRLCKTNK